MLIFILVSISIILGDKSFGIERVRVLLCVCDSMDLIEVRAGQKMTKK